MKKIIITILVLIIVVIQICFSDTKKKTYTNGDLRYLIDKDYYNKRLPKKMPDSSELKYVYIYEHANRYGIAFLLDVGNKMLYIYSGEYILRIKDLGEGISLDEEELRQFTMMITDYNIKKWSTRKSIALVYGSRWEMALEFGDSIIYHYEGKEPSNHDDFLLKWYLLVDEFSPDFFEGKGYNTWTFDDYKWELYLKEQVDESTE